MALKLIIETMTSVHTVSTIRLDNIVATMTWNHNVATMTLDTNVAFDTISAFAIFPWLLC
jgi:hypothetical protein